MENPRYWRERGHRLNPNVNGYRPQRPEEVIEPNHSAIVTCSTYDGSPFSYAQRGVKPHSELLKDTPIENVPKVLSPSHEQRSLSKVVYQSSESGVAI